MKLILLFLMASLQVCGQEVKARLVESYDLETDKFWGVDAYQNVYYSDNNILFKQNINAKTTKQQFKDFSLGTLTSVDITNPLKILLFYKDSNTVVLLDNKLNKVAKYSLNEISPLRTVSHARLAANRHLWLFNVDTQRLETFNLSSEQIAGSSLPINRKLKQMETNLKRAWLLLPESIIIYDWYANQIETIASSFEKIKVDNAQLIALSDDKRYLFAAKDKDFVELTNIEEASNSFYFMNQKLYIYCHKKLTIYQIVSKS